MKPTSILMAIAVPTLWGFGFAISKAALGEDGFPPILLTALRFSVTALALVWFFRPPVKFFRQLFVISLVSATIQYSLTYTGLDGVDASIAAIVVQLEIPFAAILAAILFKDHLGWRRTLGMLLAFVGIGLLAGEPRVQANPFSVFLVASGAFVWALGQMLIKKLGGKIDGFTLVAWVAAFAAPQLFLSSWIFEDGQWQAIRSVGWVGWAVVAYLGLIMNGVGYTMWYHILGKHDVNQVAPFLLLVPVASVITAVLFLGEPLTMLVLIGGSVVVAGVGIITIRRPRQASLASEAKVEE